jgi:hypothetical protein
VEPLLANSTISPMAVAYETAGHDTAQTGTAHYQWQQERKTRGRAKLGARGPSGPPPTAARAENQRASEPPVARAARRQRLDTHAFESQTLCLDRKYELQRLGEPGRCHDRRRP